MKPVRILVCLILAALLCTTGAHADSYEETLEVFRKAPSVQRFFDDCYGYAVFPTVGKAGIGIGGAYGAGKVYKKGVVTGTAKLFKATIGFQLGGQAFSEVIFFQDQRAYEDFTGGSFEFDASASAVVVTAGIQGQAGTAGASAGASAGPATGTQSPAQYHKGMAVFAHIKGGLMYEASIGGQKFSFQPIDSAK